MRFKSSLTLLALIAIGCSTRPADTASLEADSSEQLTQMKAEDPELDGILQHSFGYVIFPSVGKGAFIAGGAYGHGQVYRQGQFDGYADISEASIGAQAGGEAFAELLVFQDSEALVRFESGQLAFSANVSAVILKSGEAGAAKFADGVAVFILPKSGFMLEAAVGGQSFAYTPK